jgi:hypothetical protein
MAASPRWPMPFASLAEPRHANPFFVQKSPLKAHSNQSGLFLWMTPARGASLGTCQRFDQVSTDNLAVLLAWGEGLTSSPMTAACSNPSDFNRRNNPLVWSLAQEISRPPLV